MNKVFGIDLGTTYSCIAYVDEHGKPVVVKNVEGETTTPSVVFFESADNIVVGQAAKETAKVNPNEVVSFIKRSMGDANFLFTYQDKSYRPEEISGYILRKLVNDAQQQLGEPITEVVITCPAYFGINEREATKRAGEIAGLQVRQIINEPTAAAIAYGSTETKNHQVVLVYDLGGGTFDITMIEIKPDAIEVICTGGDHNLGGKDWDDRVVQYLVQQFQEQTGIHDDILEDPETCQELQLTAEKLKKTLTQRDRAPTSVTHGGERAKVELTLEKFNELTQDLLEKTISLTHDMLNEANKKGYQHFDEFLLVGGSTRMRQIAPRVAQEFAIQPKMFDPDEAVAKGAALYGWKLSIGDELVKRIATATGKTIQEVQRMATEEVPQALLQKAEKEVANLTGFTLGAVKKSRVQIKNVTSKSFGVVAFADNDQTREWVVNLVLKNTTVPTEVTQRFGTHQTHQETVEVRIMENEVTDAKTMPEIAVEIGTALLENLPPNLPAGSPIDILFKLNEEGRLEVTAIDATGGQTISVTIQTASVIQGEELAEAKARSQAIVVS
jgi:molecular chaperone DnaK (HSP70)